MRYSVSQSHLYEFECTPSGTRLLLPDSDPSELQNSFPTWGTGCTLSPSTSYQDGRNMHKQRHHTGMLLSARSLFSGELVAINFLRACTFSATLQHFVHKQVQRLVSDTLRTFFGFNFLNDEHPILVSGFSSLNILKASSRVITITCFGRMTASPGSVFVLITCFSWDLSGHIRLEIEIFHFLHGFITFFSFLYLSSTSLCFYSEEHPS